MANKTLDLYRQYGIRTILAGLQIVVGKPRDRVTDETIFRKEVVDQTWNLLPLPLRLLGRKKMRWDEYFKALRVEVFLVVDQKLTLRPDTPSRLEALALRLFGVQQASSETSTQVAKPAKTLSASPAKPKAVAQLPGQQPVSAKVASPSSPSPGSSKSVTAGIAVGIDLGTTYSVVAYVDSHGRPTSISNAQGDLITPSVVLFDESGPVVGKEAVQAAALEPEKVAICVKRDMGSKYFRHKINGEPLPPEVISSLILRSLKGDVRRKLGDVNRAVITVPAYFDESRRRATMDAGRLAGLEVLDIINEPTAAAIAYGYHQGFLKHNQPSQGSRPLRVLVYDLGGGTFDVTIVEINGNSFRALATDGDVSLGGKDWDEKIVDLAAQRFMEAYREDPRGNPSSLQDLWIGAENAKKTLSERTRATLIVHHLGQRIRVEVTRDEFEERTAALLGRTRSTLEIVIRQAGLTWSAIDRVLLVGGSTRMPQVARMIEEVTGRPPEKSLEVDEAVAHGAALYANLLVKHLSAQAEPPQFSVTNINSHSLGIVGIDPSGRKRNQILIPKNTPLPTTVTRVFKTAKPGQANVVIRVVEGESERPEACIPIGACTIDGLPPQLPAGTPVEVRYAYKTNGQLQVSGQILGLQVGAKTLFHRENSLDDEQIGLWHHYVDEDN